MLCAPADPESADARALTAELDAALAAICGDSGAGSFDPADVRGPGSVFLSGAGRFLLAALEAQAAAFGYREVRLSTSRVNVRALAFYARNGYVAVESFGRYVGREESVCLGKPLR